jgi:hypothetical protein
LKKDWLTLVGDPLVIGSMVLPDPNALVSSSAPSAFAAAPLELEPEPEPAVPLVVAPAAVDGALVPAPAVVLDASPPKPVVEVLEHPASSTAPTATDATSTLADVPRMSLPRLSSTRAAGVPFGTDGPPSAQISPREPGMRN